MATLNSYSPANSFSFLLNVTNGIAGTLKDVTDGLDNATPLQLSTTAVNIDGTFTVSGVATNTTGYITSGTFADARIAASNVTQHVAAIDHDSLLNYVANEHIDWTAATSAFSTSGTAATGNLTVTGNITVSGTVDGRDVATDGTKLDGIETSADVTDETNVVSSLNGATLSAVTVTSTDKVLIQDTSDSNTLKTATAISVANLASSSVGLSKSITVQNPTAAEDLTITFTNRAITITEIRAVLIGSSTPSVTWTVRHGTDRSAAGNEVVTSGTTTTSVTSGDDVTSFNDATIAADSFIWLETTAQSGIVNELSVTFYYTED